MALEKKESTPCLPDDVIAETINNTYRQPIDPDSRATGTVIEEDGVLYVQKCLHGEYYYESCETYGDTDTSTTIMAYSTDTWSLCDSATMEDNPNTHVDNDFDQWLLEENRRMAYQGMLAQTPLKPSIRPPANEDWERMRKYFGYVPAKTVRNTYKYSTQHGVLPPSSHLQMRVSNHQTHYPTFIDEMRLMPPTKFSLIQLQWMVVKQVPISSLDMIRKLSTSTRSKIIVRKNSWVRWKIEFATEESLQK